MLQRRMRAALVKYCAFALSFFLIAIVFQSFRLSENHGVYNHILHPFAAVRKTLPRNAEHRIAILLPYTTHDGESTTNNAADVLSYFPVFCAGAAGAADIADFLIFHTGILDAAWPLLRTECPANVKFISLGSHRGLAERLLRVVDHKYDNRDSTNTNHGDDDKPKMDKDELLQFVTSYVKENPYGLVEFKPALGHIFQDYLTDSSYTHWGYSDLDILFGDLGRWITLDELTDYDIVTYTFGDQQRLYLRGQFTFHKNNPATINQLWRQCDYLTAMDERFEKLVKHDEKYHVESAEGCYSAAILDRTDIAVKFAVKAWTDIYTDDTAYSHGVFLARSHKTGRQVLYKAIKERIEESGKQVARLQPDWFEVEDTVYKNRKNPIQRQVGERELIEHEADPKANCMYWALPKYQSKLCLKAVAVSPDETVFWINGKLYKQRYENAVLKTPVATAPFFHFQEWKRSYRHGQLASLVLSSPIQTFVLTPEGAIPMIEGKNPPEPTVASPLGLFPMKRWTALKEDDRRQLPDNTYCIASSVDGSGKRTKCNKAVSWHNNHTTILATAPGWTTVDVESDVTLVLTLQITASQATNMRALQNVVDHLKVSLHRWHGQPCVVVISVSGGTTETADLLKEKLDADKSAYLYSSLVAVVYEKSTTELSRKALLNMAIDAVPTRWYLSGLELERGLSISVDSGFFAHRAAASHSRLRGTVFLLPQFGLLDFVADKKPPTNEGEDETTDIVISLEDLLFARRKSKIKNLSTFDEPCEDEDLPDGIDRLGSVNIEWWVETHVIADPKKRNKDFGDDIARRAASIEDLQHGIVELATGDHGENMLSNLDESPILLTDNLGPHEGIRTSEIAREVEAFVELRCFNGMRLKQLAILGYTFDVLAGAFAASSEVSRKAAQSGVVDGSTRCNACSIFTKEFDGIILTIATTEIKRVAKTAVMWAESLGVKQ